MKQFRIVDNIVGWVVFFIAAFVYCSTIEPTASFWDCPEFIDTGYKMQIGHPPGAPFFMLTANLFSQFASDPSDVARMVNTMSALLSAACILFLFWSITHLVRRMFLLKSDSTMPLNKLLTIEFSGVVGALIYTFSDTFWFSAVEGEVYAYSSAFTAVVFWLILKWEDHADEPHSDRWLILIMYMTGLSIGVHLLNLLCLPAIVLVYYYKRYPKASGVGAVVALVVSAVLLAAVLYGVVPGIITVGGWFELLFVNVMGLPFNTGVIVYLILLIGCVIWAIYETQCDSEKNWQRQNVAFLLGFALLGVPFYGFGLMAVLCGIIVLSVVCAVLFYRPNGKPVVTARVKNTTLLCMLMLMIGYSSYAVIVIRSSANTPMDQNSPEDIFTLGNYLSRDQYGYRPLLYGQTYASEYKLTKDGRVDMTDGAPVYQRVEKASASEPDRYKIVTTKDQPKYAQNMLFPRVYSSAHAEYYNTWLGGVEGREVESEYNPDKTITVPTMIDNLRFFFTYQCNYMYWRYFMWNFAGRQNDLQGTLGELEKGNWICGIPFIDDARLGCQDYLPDDLKNNKGRNVFYMMPLLLGILGILWQLFMRGKKGIQQFWVVFFLFFMTGLAIVLYLNQTPVQPRERDYAYAGSFYAYAIWCGMGVAALSTLILKGMKLSKVHIYSPAAQAAVALVVGLVCLVVPIQMASQTWDDHDRSGRYTCRDFGQNYLMSLQQEGNPIIFTNGDNDTFPLWYNQDVEGVRTDARVCNLSYLATDWYIDQMIRPAYDSPTMPITWPRLKYVTGVNDYVSVDPRMKNTVIQFYQQSPAEARAAFGDDPFELKNILEHWVQNPVSEDLHVIPTDTVYITIDKAAVRRSGMMLQGDSIPDRMAISLVGQRGLDKSKLMMLEMLANANWERPIYVAMTVGQENYMNLGEHFVQEGLANRITPFHTQARGMSDFDTDKTYDNVMNRFKFGGLSEPGIYLDETVMRMCYTHRRLLAQLATSLVQKGETKKALDVLELAQKELPSYNVPHDYQSGSLDLAKAFAILERYDEADDIATQLWTRSSQYMEYYLTLADAPFKAYAQSCRLHIYLMQMIQEVVDTYDEEKASQYFAKLNDYFDDFQKRGGRFN